MKILDILKSFIASKGVLSILQKEALLTNINLSYTNYSNLSKKEKEQSCIELAQDLGCESDDLSVCSNYIYFHANGEHPQVS